MKFDHVGIVVASVTEALEVWKPFLGTPSSPPEEVPGNDIRVAFLAAGELHVELVEPTSLRSPVSKFLATRGPGMHHIAFAVPDVDAALAGVVARGGRVIDHSARRGARGRLVGFAHPSAFGGVLVEFVEELP